MSKSDNNNETQQNKEDITNSDSAQKNTDTPNNEQSDNNTNQGPKKQRGIGFLGRRGTAPIRTNNTENDDSKKQENAQDTEKNDDNNKTENIANTAPTPQGHAHKIFLSLSKFSFASISFLIVLLLLQTFSSIWLPSVFFPQEFNLIEVYSDMKGMGHWLVPPSTEHIQAAFPAYFWFMALIDTIPISDAIFLPLVTFFSSLLFLCSVYTLGICTGLGRQVSFAAGLLVLISPGFISLSHVLSVDFFTASLFTFALALLCKAWMSDFAPMSFIFGFLFLALATLGSGFLPLWVILISNFLFIFWRGTFGRAHKLDAVMGFGVLVFSFAIWLVIIIIGGGPQANTLELLMNQMISPFFPPFWPLKPTWYYGITILALGIIPWICLPIFASWLNILKNSMTSLKGARKENSGVAWLYIVLTVGCALLILSGKLSSSIILWPVIIVLLAKVLCNLSALGSKSFFMLLAVFAFIAGIVCVGFAISATASMLLQYMPEQASLILNDAQGLEIVGLILLLISIILLKFSKSSHPCGTILVLTMCVLLLVQPFTMLFAPSIVNEEIKYHHLGTGFGILPYGLGAPMPAVVIVNETEATIPTNTEQNIPNDPQPEITETAPRQSDIPQDQHLPLLPQDTTDLNNAPASQPNVQ